MSYADVLGEDDPTRSGLGPQAMISSIVPRIYERVWRPLFAPVLMAGRRDELAMALQMLELRPGDSVLDVGCGPGNFTRAFARASFDGLAVGLDASRTMLDQAAREHNPPNLRYVRGDAAALPFPDASFDAVCCFAALYFIAEPTAGDRRDGARAGARRPDRPAGEREPRPGARRRRRRDRAPAQRDADLWPGRSDAGTRGAGPDGDRSAGGRAGAVRVGSSPTMNGSSVTGSSRRGFSVTVILGL